jgi:methionyl-tRNA formyltransferase
MTQRIIFMGTPQFAVPVLTGLVAQGHDICAAYTQPPRPAGRGMSPRKSPVHEKASQFGIPVHTPRTLRNHAEQQQFGDYGADFAVVVAYGLILPPAILAATRKGAFNAHASLLPRWRGAAPINRAIMAGDTETGIMVMKMDDGLDTGPVALTERVPIPPEMTAGQLHDILSALGAELIVRAAAALERGTLDLTPQPETGVTYARKIDKAETRVDWTRPAAEVHNHVRGLSPRPGAWCEMPLATGGERVRLLRSMLAEGEGAPGAVLDSELRVACGAGAVRILRLQRAGRQPADVKNFLRGGRMEVDAVMS